MNIEAEIKKVEQLLAKGRIAEAKSACHKILRRHPRNVPAKHLLGGALLFEKKYPEARKYIEQVLALNPRHANALNNLALILNHEGQLAQAIACLKQALELDPINIEALINIGQAYFLQHDNQQAESYYRRVLELAPGNVPVMASLGVLLAQTDRKEEGINFYRKALELAPDDDSIQANLLSAVYGIGYKEEASRLARKISLLPNFNSGMYTAYNFAKKHCLWDIIERLQPRIIKAILAGVASKADIESVLLDMLAAENISNNTLFEMHKAIGQKIENSRMAPPYSEYQTDVQKNRKLRIGYISPDLRAHVVSTYLRGVINFYDRERFEVYCYSSTRMPDGITEQYKKTVDNFVDIVGMSDFEAAKKIHDDGIHILVELAGYTAHSRIAVLAYRPAPIQVTYIGYPYTSGMTTVDYIVADSYIAGEKLTRYCTEKPLVLAEGTASFGDLYEQEINPVIPYDRLGYITFGSLINPYKINPSTLRVWSEILHALPESKFIFNHPTFALEEAQSMVRAEFSKYDIDQKRIQFIFHRLTEGTHLRFYNDLDIALDTFPMTGGASSFDAPWMGVPMITLVGDAYSERLTYSILKNLRTPVDDLIAFSVEEYVEKAVSLANNPERIRELHIRLPEGLKNSVFTDPILFTRHLEAAYVRAWNERFPEHCLPDIREHKPILYVPVGGVEIVVPESLENHQGYVLREQGKWYDPEYGFVLGLAKLGGRVIDIGAGVGSYAAPLAKKLGPKGEVTAIVTPGAMYVYLGLTKEHNKLTNLRVLQGEDHKFNLNALSSGWPDTDLVRIGHDVNSDNGGSLAKFESLFEGASPLVMFSIRTESGLDLTGANLLLSLGYELYRFIPGINGLVPYTGVAELDLLSLNLFAAKPARAQRLERDGLLVRQVMEPSEFPGITDTAWMAYLEKLPYFAALQGVMGTLPSDEWSDVYHIALNLFARAKDSGFDLGTRFMYLEMACHSLASLVENAPNLARLLSVARVLTEAGKRQAAVGVLDHLISLIHSESRFQIDEPFLALSEHFETIDPRDRLADWLVVSIYEQREKLRAFSSYFTGQESLETLESLRQLGFSSKEMDTRICLIRERFSNEVLQSGQPHASDVQETVCFQPRNRGVLQG